MLSMKSLQLLFIISLISFSQSSLSSPWEQLLKDFGQINQVSYPCVEIAASTPAEALQCVSATEAATQERVQFAGQSSLKGITTGVHLWAGDPSQDQVMALFDELKLSSARMTMGPNWDQLKVSPPTDVSGEMMDKFIRENFNADYPHRMSSAQSLNEALNRKGVKKNFVQFRAPKIWRSSWGNALKKEHVDDYARFLTSLVKHLSDNGVTLDTIELSNEPDGSWDTSIPPERYAELVARVREEFAQRGVKMPLIAGPGVAMMKKGKAWLEAIDKNPKAKLDIVSLHAWDQKLGDELDAQWVSDWAKKKKLPLQISEFADAKKGHGTLPDDSNNPKKSVAFTSAYGVRTYSNALSMLNQGASEVLFWEANDQAWNHMSWGMLDAEGKSKPALEALRTLFPHIKESYRLHQLKNSKHQNDIMLMGDDSQGLLSLANTSAQAKEYFIDLSGLNFRFGYSLGSYPMVRPMNGNLQEGCILKITIPAHSNLSLQLN